MASTLEEVSALVYKFFWHVHQTAWYYIPEDWNLNGYSSKLNIPCIHCSIFVLVVVAFSNYCLCTEIIQIPYNSRIWFQQNTWLYKIICTKLYSVSMHACIFTFVFLTCDGDQYSSSSIIFLLEIQIFLQQIQHNGFIIWWTNYACNTKIQNEKVLSISLNKTVKTEIQCSILYWIFSQIWLWSHMGITSLKNFSTSSKNNFGHSLMPWVTSDTMTIITVTFIVH